MLGEVVFQALFDWAIERRWAQVLILLLALVGAVFVLVLVGGLVL